ncbi:MAG: flagellar basal body P-ring protein FlgI [Leptospirales bacterium]|nr:flagellar basal body P-ring protein FlgI [Leptospirales bacterium]
MIARRHRILWKAALATAALFAGGLLAQAAPNSSVPAGAAAAPGAGGAAGVGGAATTPAAPASGEEGGVRLKDLARISGVRSNQLLGYGLVVGLAGTGDSRSRLAEDSIRNLLGSLGQEMERSAGNARNIAAVLVTAEAPPFSRPGDRINATVSSIGDARSLHGGVLVQTPLYAGNRTIYAVAQGVITTGGRGGGRSGERGETVGLLLNGATLEREINGALVEESQSQPPLRRVRISLNSFDFSTLQAVRDALQREMPEARTEAEGGSLLVTLPENADAVSFIARMEQVRILPNSRARVIINERSGVIVMGGDLRIDPVSVSRGGMELILTPRLADARMGIYVQGGQQQQQSEQTTQQLSGTSVEEIVKALNALGASVRDIIAILEALRDSGALHADIVVI